MRDPLAVRVRRFTVVHPRERSIRFQVVPPKMVIGRDPEGDSTVLLQDGQASRSHASVEYLESGDLFRIRDLGSKNGTHLDGERIEEPEYLRPGAVVRIGETLLVYSEIEPRATFDADGPSLALAHAQALADMAVCCRSTAP